VAAIHRDFLTAAAQSLERVDEIGTDVDEGRLECGDEMNAALYEMESKRRAEQSIAALERRGYTVFGE
jgi:hypothetical protein